MRKAYELVKEEDRLIKARDEAANEKLDGLITKRPKFEVESWAWIYDDKSTISGGGKHVLKPSETDSRSEKFALTAKLAQCWTGPYKILFVGPGTTSDGKKDGPSLLLVEVRKNEPGSEVNARVSKYRCKQCHNPHERVEWLKFLPWAMSSYVLNKYSERSPPFHLTAKDVCMELDQRRINPTTITKHRISRGLGGKNAAQYYTSWDEVSVKTWEHETDLEQYRSLVSKYWAGGPVVGGENARYRR